MPFLITTVLLLAASLLPLIFQADIHHHAQTKARIRLRFLCFYKDWLISGLPGTAAQLRQSRSRLLLDTLLRADKARHFLLRRLHLEQLNALVLLRTGDASSSALLSGAIQGVAGCIPAVHRKNIHIRVLPEFYRAHSTVRARCIIRLRLGTIILTAMMLLTAFIRSQQLTESEAI